MVTLLYWLLLFPIFRYTTVVDIHLHLINALVIMTDLGLSRLPYWLLHFPFPLAYLSSYIIFSGIYYAAGGTNPDKEDYIYPWSVCMYVRACQPVCSISLTNACLRQVGLHAAACDGTHHPPGALRHLPHCARLPVGPGAAVPAAGQAAL